MINFRVLIQILCSYVTLPLYALVTQVTEPRCQISQFRFGSSEIVAFSHMLELKQMGSTMKPTIFNERVASALRNWHHTARKHIKQNKGSMTPLSSRPTTPSHHMSPVHLLRHYRSEIDSIHTSPRRSNFDMDQLGNESSPTHLHQSDGSSLYHNPNTEHGTVDRERAVQLASVPQPTTRVQHQIDIVPKDFSFETKSGV